MISARVAAPALFAALLFGASTPLAKWLGVGISPLLLAGLLYLGSGLGLSLVLAWREAFGRHAGGVASRLHVPRADLPWLVTAIVVGGMLGPVLLMQGLTTTAAGPAALLLNVESVATAVIAWLVFRENADRRVVLGMCAIVAGGVLLAWQPGTAALSTGALLIVAACLCWAVDNNLTRRVSANDAVLLACLKGLVAGIANTALALLSGSHLPAATAVVEAMLIGFFGYGLSLVLFVVALRALGSARTGAYFSVAPLFGVVVAFVIWPAAPAWTFWVAAALMGLGVWLHLRERHAHDHTHLPLEHAHPHRHDEHHRHAHADGSDGAEPHVHAHRHAVQTHAHRHFPDIHHRHTH